MYSRRQKECLSNFGRKRRRKIKALHSSRVWTKLFFGKKFIYSPSCERSLKKKSESIDRQAEIFDSSMKYPLLKKKTVFLCILPKHSMRSMGIEYAFVLLGEDWGKWKRESLISKNVLAPFTMDVYSKNEGGISRFFLAFYLFEFDQKVSIPLKKSSLTE
jgi:hypothetical protein